MVGRPLAQPQWRHARLARWPGCGGTPREQQQARPAAGHGRQAAGRAAAAATAEAGVFGGETSSFYAILGVVRRWGTWGRILPQVQHGGATRVPTWHRLPTRKPPPSSGLQCPSADPREIKRAYHSMMREFHPDRMSGSEESQQLCVLLNEIYEVSIVLLLLLLPPIAVVMLRVAQLAGRPAAWVSAQHHANLGATATLCAGPAAWAPRGGPGARGWGVGAARQRLPWHVATTLQAPLPPQVAWPMACECMQALYVAHQLCVITTHGTCARTAGGINDSSPIDAHSTASPRKWTSSFSSRLPDLTWLCCQRQPGQRVPACRPAGRP